MIVQGKVLNLFWTFLRLLKMAAHLRPRRHSPIIFLIVLRKDPWQVKPQVRLRPLLTRNHFRTLIKARSLRQAHFKIPIHKSTSISFLFLPPQRQSRFRWQVGWSLPQWVYSFEMLYKAYRLNSHNKIDFKWKPI